MKRGKSNMFQLSFLSRNARKIFLYSHSFWLHNCCIPGYFRVTKKNRKTNSGVCAFLPHHSSHSFCLSQNLEQSSASHNRLLPDYQTHSTPFLFDAGVEIFSFTQLFTLTYLVHACGIFTPSCMDGMSQHRSWSWLRLTLLDWWHMAKYTEAPWWKLL